MSTIVRIGSSPFVANLFTFTFKHVTGANEPSVGDVVSLNSSGDAQKVTADGERAVGVVVSKSGGYVVVCMHGIVEVVAGGSISVGDRVYPAAGGKVKALGAAPATYTPSYHDSQNAVIGIALTSAAAADDKLIVALEVV